MATIKIETGYGDIVECRDFFDIVGTSTNVSGIEIFRDGERLGSAFGLSVPDESDTDEVENFKEEIEEWLVDNEF